MMIDTIEVEQELAVLASTSKNTHWSSSPQFGLKLRHGVFSKLGDPSETLDSLDIPKSHTKHLWTLMFWCFATSQPFKWISFPQGPGNGKRAFPWATGPRRTNLFLLRSDSQRLRPEIWTQSDQCDRPPNPYSSMELWLTIGTYRNITMDNMIIYWCKYVISWCHHHLCHRSSILYNIRYVHVCICHLYVRMFILPGFCHVMPFHLSGQGAS